MQMYILKNHCTKKYIEKAKKLLKNCYFFTKLIHKEMDNW